MTEETLQLTHPPVVHISRPAGRFLPLAEWTEAVDRLSRTRARPGPSVAVFRMATVRPSPYPAGPPLGRVLAAIDAQLTDSELLTSNGKDLAVMLRDGGRAHTARRLAAINSRLATTFNADNGGATPVCGWTTTDPAGGENTAALLDRATTAAAYAAQKLDLQPIRWRPDLAHPPSARLNPTVRTWLQVAITGLLGLVAPFAILIGLLSWGVDLVTPAYLAVVAALVITSALTWAESLHALDPKRPPANRHPCPTATAIIAAYLPNEADTIMDTVRAVLAQDYPGRFQVILAYNTPHPLPVEAELRMLARHDRRLTVLEVPFSTSKAQNVNAALDIADGEFVGVFDADHHPARTAFRRAWQWIDNGATVVQGHCVVRNGSHNRVTRTVAVEFESIYAVSHPGRAALHGFGIFGGSNGFWRTSALRRIRMRPDMLTEDIDASVRLLAEGHTVISDPSLLSRELAPTSWGSLWHQRMRWAQGWYQVSKAHLGATLRSPHLTVRNKLGFVFLLGWREITPWASIQIIPVIAALAWRAGGVTELDWLIPAFLLTSVYALSIGPVQTLFTWRLAVPEIRRHGWWFAGYMLMCTLFYSELKNVIARVAQVKELWGERRWVITPRETGDGS